MATMPQENAQTHLSVRPDWIALRHEEALEPDLPIVDPHHHLWERGGSRYLLPDLLDDIGGGHRIDATIFVECRSMYRSDGPIERRSLGETEFVNGVAAMSTSGTFGPARICAGIIGKVDLTTGDHARELLEAHVAIAGARFRGIRNVTAWHANDLPVASVRLPPGLLRDATFRRGFAALAPLGLTFDAWMVHTQLDEMRDLARDFPQTGMILDHVGGPIGIGPYASRRNEVFTTWRQGIREIATCPNVSIKLGGLGMRVMGFDFHARPLPPSSADLADAWRPYIEACIEAFGPQRCMFESNFPVDKATCSFTILWNAFKRIAAGCSREDKLALFGGTAMRVYGLPSD